MSVTRSILRTSVLSLSVLPVLALAACGDGSGWEAKPYYGVPYGPERTAGHGVEWVRASMMPAKTTITETIMKKETTVTAPAVTTPPPPPVTSGDKVFNNKQSK